MGGGWGRGKETTAVTAESSLGLRPAEEEEEEDDGILSHQFSFSAPLWAGEPNTDPTIRVPSGVHPRSIINSNTLAFARTSESACCAFMRP